MAEKEQKRGPSAVTVAANVKRIRERERLTYTQLSERLDGTASYPISPVGVRRIEEGDRRVNVDDLMALAAALGVSPVTLLMPHTDSREETVAATGLGSTTAADLWHWIVANGRLGMPLVEYMNFLRNSLPPWIFAEREDQINSQIGSMFPTPAVRDVLRPQEDR